MPPLGSTDRLDAHLRRAVLDHVGSESRRVFAAAIHLGLPGGPCVELTLDRRQDDQALCTDVLESMVARHRRRHHDVTPLVWLTRRGTLEAQDLDLRWSSAAHHAALELEVALPMAVVTRQGWRDPRTGETRTWRRLRPARG